MGSIVLMLGLLMVVIAVAVIVAMIYMGYDVRSRGFTANGPVVATLPKLGIGFKAYFAKKDEHPVTDETLLPKVRTYRILTILFLVLSAAMLIATIASAFI